VARWLEGITGDRIADHAEVLAHHYESAMELFSASGMTEQAAETVEPTVRFLLLAAERAETLDPATAQRHYDRVLGLMAPEDSRRANVLLGLADVFGFSGEFEEAISFDEEALRLSRAAGDRRTEGKALSFLSSDYWRMGRTAESHDLIAKAITTLEQVGPGPELAVAYIQASDDALSAGVPSQSLVWTDKALSVAEKSGDLRHAIEARANRAWAHCELGDMEALDNLRAAYRDSVALGHGDQISIVGDQLSAWLWWIEGPANALRISEEIIARSERRGLAALAMHGRAKALRMKYDLGEWDRLLDEGRQIMPYIETWKDVTIETVALPYIAQVLAWRQQREEAFALCEQCLPRARELEDLQTLVPALAASAYVAKMRRQPEIAVGLIEELGEVTRHTGPWRSRHLPTALRVLIDAGEPAKADEFIEGIAATATRDLNCVLTGQAIVAEAKGEMSEARSLYEHATQRWADYGFVLEEGQADLGFARCLIALGDRRVATEPLQEARGIFSRLGAVPLLNETDGYLQRAQAAF
jgi:tetratricopeptide (TPR) repeat protein